MKKIKSILCIGDSLSMPRNTVLYKDTWYSKLKKEFPNIDFNPQFKRAITTDVLVEWGGGDFETIESFPFGSDCLEFYKPDIVILQLGIVDCAPRLIRNGSLNFYISKILKGKLLKIYFSFLKRYTNRNSYNVKVSKDKFRNNIENYLKRCKNEKIYKVIIIGICYPNDIMIKKNQLITNNVNDYNNIFKDISKKYNFVKFISPLDARKYNYEIYVDGYHPNTAGNRLVYDSLLKEFI